MSVSVTPRSPHTRDSSSDVPLVSQGSMGFPQATSTLQVPASSSALEMPPASEEEDGGNPKEDDGELTEEDVAGCLYDLGPCATGLEFTYRSLAVPGRNLTDISILDSYVHLQRLEVSHNKIKDLSCVSHMPYLIFLDASHNEISKFFGFRPPKNLKEVDLSYNQMSEMKVLSACSSLSKLNLDHNSFREIRGLEMCSSLTHLSLANNRIFLLKGLDKLPLIELRLKGNHIRKIENIEKIGTLQTLDLASNKIQGLSGLQNLNLLGSLNLEGNAVGDIKETKHLHDLPLLRELNLQRNPVQDEVDYRLAVVFLLQQLSMLDQRDVTAEEKVSAVNKYDPPPEVTAARDHMMHVVYQLRQPQVIFHSTLPSLNTPYPMLVLAGPQACGKRELAHRLCQDFSHFFAYGICHTTRCPYFGEEEGSDYHFVSEEQFQDMIHGGKFIQTVQYGGHRYGLSREAIEEVAREGLACCVHMELEGVHSLKNTYLEPRYVLLVPTDREGYRKSLRRRGLYTVEQMDSAVARIDAYVRLNREHPGYFDNVMTCDDIGEAYSTLCQVVREYLGLEEQGGGISSRATPENPSTGDSLMDARALGGHTPGTGLGEQTDVSRKLYSKVQQRLAPPKSPAEVASLQKKQQLAREALNGKSPGAYTQPMRVSLTAPGSTAVQAPPTPIPPEPSENNSLQESHADSAQPSPRDSTQGGERGAGDLPEPAHDLESLRDHTESGSTPRTASSPGVQSESASARPGSNVKPVLPPIPSGRKTATPKLTPS